jgi:hypothetical protein
MVIASLFSPANSKGGITIAPSFLGVMVILQLVDEDILPLII